MPLSSFTGLPLVADGSAATTGLFNARYSILSQNLDQLNASAASAGDLSALSTQVSQVSSRVSTFDSNYSGSIFSNLSNQWFNVKNYGAVGDGVVDDTNAIQTAINEAGSITSRPAIVYFPHGIYSYSSFSVAFPVTLQGAGAPNSVLYSNQSNDQSILFDYVATQAGIDGLRPNVGMRGLGVWRSTNDLTGTALVLGSAGGSSTGANGFLGEDVRFMGFARTLFMREKVILPSFIRCYFDSALQHIDTDTVGLTDSGENISFWGCFFGGGQARANNIRNQTSGFNFEFVASSLDGVTFNLANAGATAHFVNCHFEHSTGTIPIITQSAGMADLHGCEVYATSNYTAPELVSISGGRLALTNNVISSTGTTGLLYFTQSGSGSVYESGTRLISASTGFADPWFTNTSSGALVSGPHQRLAVIAPYTAAASIASGGNHTPDMSGSVHWEYTVNGSNVTINNPSATQVGAELFFEFLNNSGGAITIFLGSNYKTAGAVAAPADTKRRVYVFQVRRDLTLVEKHRSQADI